MKRAIGITRVSAEGDRETIHSYNTQADRITDSCQREGVQLLYVGQERNVSGGANLINRPELSKAVEAVENGQADVIVAAYFDRFFRSLEVQGEVIRRIEKAGGELLTLDHGQLTNATPAKRMESNIIGAISQYFREQTGEKVRDGHKAAVAAGKLPYPIVPFGYLKGADGRLTPDKATVAVVVELFERRAGGESVHSLCRWLTTAMGVSKSTTGVRTILKSRIYLGELHFGKLVNLTAHEAIVEPDLWAAANRATGHPGRPSRSSERLLARLRVLKCHCGANMGVGSSVQNLGRKGLTTYYCYRCSANPPCGARAMIAAPIAEAKVWEAVRDALRDAQGRASIAESAQDAISGLATAQGKLDAALRVFSLTGAENESGAVERIGELKMVRDGWQAQVDQIGPNVTITANPDDASFAERRDMIRASVASAVVAHGGRGADRITVNLFSKQPASCAV